MYKVTKYPHGTFSWADCSTTDWTSGKEFYIAVMGWDTEDLPMREGQFYTMFKQDGENVAAISAMSQEMQDGGMPPMWNNYITVDDVDALVGKVTELGGKIVMPPMDVFEDGRMMVVQDPTGGTVSLWQAKNTIGAGLVNTVGAMLWNELTTPDPQKVMDFFKELLGWDYQRNGEMDYWMIVNNGRMNGGIMKLTEEMGDMPPVWTVYYNVASLDDTLQKVTLNKGKIFMKSEAEGVGKFAVVADPQGAVLTVMEATNIDTWEEN